MSRLDPSHKTPGPKPVERRHFFKRLVGAMTGGLVLGTASAAHAATQEPYPTQQVPPVYIGEIRMIGGTYAPVGWLLCDGTEYGIFSYTTLFSIIGVLYGGNGITTFAVPDFRGRVPISFGTGPGLSPRQPGSTGGDETHLLTSDEMPAHNHESRVSGSLGSSNDPEGLVNAVNPAGTPHYGLPAGNLMDNSAIGDTGGGQPHNVMQPYLTVNFIIAWDGMFPVQS